MLIVEQWSKTGWVDRGKAWPTSPSPLPYRQETVVTVPRSVGTVKGAVVLKFVASGKKRERPA